MKNIFKISYKQLPGIILLGLSACGQNSHMTLDEVKGPVDTTAPTATLSGGGSGVINTALQTLTVTFSEAVSAASISAGDFDVTNGSLSNLNCIPALAPTSCTFDVTASGQGAVNVQMPASAVQDAAGNNNDASNAIAWTFDSIGPTVSIAVEVGEPASGSSTNDSSIALTLTASESIAALVAGDFTCTNCTVSGISGSGTSWTLNVIPSGLGAVSVELAASAVQDGAGNSNTLASNTLNWTYNNVAPAFTLAPASGAPASGSVTNTSPVAVELSSSAAVTGLVAGDIVCTGCSINSFSGSGASYSFDVLPSGQGAFSVNVPSSVAEDAATNQNTASNTLNWSYDTSAPSATLAVGSGGAASGSTTNAASIPITVSMGESVTGLIAGDFTCTNCTLSGFSGSGSSYSFNVVPTASGAVSVQLPAGRAADAAGNGNTISNTLSWTYDNTVPTVVLSSSASSPTALNPIPITVTFSETMSISSISLSDFIVSSGDIPSNLICGGSPTICTLDITPSNATVTVQLAASVTEDLASNVNAVSNSFSITTGSCTPDSFVFTTTGGGNMFLTRGTLTINANHRLAHSAGGTGAGYYYADNGSYIYSPYAWTGAGTLTLETDCREDLKQIYAYNSNIASIPDLRGGFTSLNFSYNQISSLSSTVIFDLANLAYLNLGYNSLTDLDSDFFVNNRSLSNVNLSSNQLTDIDPDWFEFGGLSNVLNTVDLSYNHIAGVDNTDFNNNPALAQLSLQNNTTYFTYVQANSFDNNTALAYLSMQYNSLTDLDSNIFVNNRALYSVKINNNQLTDIDPDWFEFGGLSNVLNTVDLSYNHIAGVDNTDFNNNPALARLSLQNNTTYFTYVQANSFDNNTALAYLSMQYNSLTDLDSNIFVNNRALYSVNINNNQLTDIDPDWFEFGGLSNVLNTVDLSYNHIAGVDNTDFNNNPALARLSLQNNTTYFTYVQANSFDNNTALAYLSMQYNSLTDLDSNIFVNNRALYSVNINNNQLTDIDPDWFEFGGLSNVLNTVYLSYNHIAGVDNTDFNNNPALAHLSLQNNTTYFTYVQANSFDNNTALSSLNLGYNSLGFGSVDDVFVSLDSLGTSSKYVYTSNQNPLAPPTPASSTARLNLAARAWAMYHD